MTTDNLTTLDDIINNTKDPRELKRALSVKMVQAGLSRQTITSLLNKSEQYVSKCKSRYEKGGASGLRVAYKGRKPYLKEEEQQAVVGWLQGQETMTVEKLRDHIEEEYGVVYRSKQSYYDLLSAGGMSYHRVTAVNPKRDEEKIMNKREEIKKKVAEHQEEIEEGKVVVLFEDEGHLLWGDVCGLSWGKRNHAIEAPVGNQKLRQTYYGAVNYRTGQFHLQSFDAGNGQNTVAHIEWLRQIYANARLWLVWDGASYHQSADMRNYLAKINADLPEEKWPVTCILLAPHAPEQNPVEDIWLKGKNWLRKHFAFNKTFADVKKCFFDHLHNGVFHSAKYDWYNPHPQIT